MATLSPDTTPEAEAVQIEALRRLGPAGRFRLVEEANRTALELARAGLRQRHPAADAAEVERRLKGLLLGEELAREVYGPLPKDGDG